MIDYRRMLAYASEPKLSEFSSKLLPGKEGVLGVRIPEVRRIAKLIIKDDWNQVLVGEPGSFEEELLRGIVIATAPVDTDTRIDLTRDFMGYIDNWSTCDTFCSSWKCPKADSDRIWDFFASLMDSGEEFPMRVSVIARMSHFKDEEHCRLLLEDLATHDNPGYYYRMGSAWAVSMIYVDHSTMTEELLRSGRLEPWTHNKAIQKIRESFRVSDEDKERLKGLRRNVL